LNLPIYQAEQVVARYVELDVVLVVEQASWDNEEELLW
jgi:hypothetical protein